MCKPILLVYLFSAMIKQWLFFYEIFLHNYTRVMPYFHFTLALLVLILTRGGHFLCVLCTSRVPTVGRPWPTVADETPNGRRYKFCIFDNLGSVGGRVVGKVGFQPTPTKITDFGRLSKRHRFDISKRRRFEFINFYIYICYSKRRRFE